MSKRLSDPLMMKVRIITELTIAGKMTKDKIAIASSKNFLSVSPWDFQDNATKT